ELGLMAFRYRDSVTHHKHKVSPFPDNRFRWLISANFSGNPARGISLAARRQDLTGCNSFNQGAIRLQEIVLKQLLRATPRDPLEDAVLHGPLVSAHHKKKQ